jgi:hypothetical protein
MDDGAKRRDLEDRTFAFAESVRWGAQAASLFFSAASRNVVGAFRTHFPKNVVGKLPTTAGWQPALPKKPT